MSKRSWRPAVKKAMLETATEETKADSSKNGFNYRWAHVNAVVQCGLRLADLTGADAEIVEASAWLHDVAKYTGRDHPQVGAKVARKLLAQTDFPSEKIDAVSVAIEQHSGLRRASPLLILESQVLWDADKLTKLGVGGAMHFLSDKVSQRDIQSGKELLKRLHSADWQEKTVASMHTIPAQKAARKRVNQYTQFLHLIESEWLGNDIL